jgi:hypothetical protein
MPLEVNVSGSTITITYTTKVESGADLVLQGASTSGGVTWTCTGGSLKQNYVQATAVLNINCSKSTLGCFFI